MNALNVLPKVLLNVVTTLLPFFLGIPQKHSLRIETPQYST